MSPNFRRQDNRQISKFFKCRTLNLPYGTYITLYIPLREENLLHAGRRKQRSNHPRGGKNISDDTHVFIE